MNDNKRCGRATDRATFELEFAHATGRIEERERIWSILSHREAAVRPVMALQLALETDLALERVVELLAKVPAEAAYAARGRANG